MRDRLETLRAILTATESLHEALASQDAVRIGRFLRVRERLMQRFDHLGNNRRNPAEKSFDRHELRLRASMKETLERIVFLNEECAALTENICRETRETVSENARRRQALHGYRSPRGVNRFIECRT